jgi:F0F1-type ATP synthase assembly protein I
MLGEHTAEASLGAGIKNLRPIEHFSKASSLVIATETFKKTIKQGAKMIQLQNAEIELIKVFVLGVFLGWTSRKYLKGHGRHTPWTLITNMKYPFMNLGRKDLKVEIVDKSKK